MNDKINKNDSDNEILSFSELKKKLAEVEEKSEHVPSMLETLMGEKHSEPIADEEVSLKDVIKNKSKHDESPKSRIKKDETTSHISKGEKKQTASVKSEKANKKAEAKKQKQLNKEQKKHAKLAAEVEIKAKKLAAKEEQEQKKETLKLEKIQKAGKPVEKKQKIEKKLKQEKIVKEKKAIKQKPQKEEKQKKAEEPISVIYAPIVERTPRAEGINVAFQDAKKGLEHKYIEKNTKDNESSNSKDISIEKNIPDEKSKLQDSVKEEIIETNEIVDYSANEDEINNILMYEYDPEGAIKKESHFNKFIRNTFPNKKDKPKEVVRKLISFTSVLVIIGCAGYFGFIYVEKQAALNQTNKLSGYIYDAISSGDDEQDAWASIKAQYPNVVFPQGMQIKYAPLYAINQDFSGWLTIPNSKIDVQIVKAEDNEKYLKQDFYGNYSKYGCPFMDYRNNINELSLNTVIYGHHMKDGLMFADLSKYKEIEGFQESPTIKFSTLYDNYVFKIYAVFITNSVPEDDNGYLFNYIFTHLTTDSAFNNYIMAVDQRKFYDTGVDIEPGDKLLTLSTCTYEFDNARLVVVARLVRDGESTDVKVNKAELNANVRYPNAWYVKSGEDNPFLEADKWYPS